MNTDLSKYEKMRDEGASPLEVGKQLRADEIDGIDFFKILRAVFKGLSLEDAKSVSIESNGITVDQWAKSIVQALEEVVKKDEENDAES
jgi:hypothetical protein